MKLSSANLYTLPIILIITIFMVSCRNSDYHKCGGLIWNTVYNVTFDGSEVLTDSIVPTLNRVAASASAFDSLSLVSKINRNETDSVDSIMRLLFLTSMKINKESNGKFDPTVGPLIQAWGFGKGHSPSADTLKIDEMLQYVGIGKCRVHNDQLLKPDPRMQFNFSAIAKGLGCDAVSEMFERNGVKSYLIEIGGEVRASGISPRGDNWKVAIDAPDAGNAIGARKSMMIIDLNEAYINNTVGVATSGNYRNYHTENGCTFGHTIDPLTGRPAETDVVSATVVAQTAMEADAYATAIMAMGYRDADEMCRRLALSACIMTADGKLHKTGFFK